MIERMIAAGIGGQGAVLMGQVISYACLKKGYYATMIPTYGPQMKGGLAMCSFVVSDEEIDSPMVNEADLLVCLNQNSLAQYGPSVKPGGIILTNSSLVKDTLGRTDVTMVEIPANELADQLGNARTLNTIMIGAIVALKGLVDIDGAMDGFAEKMGRDKTKILELNRRAMETGLRFVEECGRD